MASRRVASASPSGSVKSQQSQAMSTTSANRNVNGSPQRKPNVNNSPQRTYSQASPQRSPQRSLAGPRKVLFFPFVLIVLMLSFSCDIYGVVTNFIGYAILY